jgi:hypothetical protein
MHILISGDSWGVGEWNLTCTKVNHGGIGQYLVEDNHQVTNLSRGGTSNLDSVFRLTNYLERDQLIKPNCILIFQTEFTRDFKHNTRQQDYNSKDLIDLTSVNDIASRWIERFYTRLSEISQKYQIPVYIIGGCSDTMFFDDIDSVYPGCKIACQSTTNLLITGNHQIDDPVFSWYTQSSLDFLNKIKSISSGNDLDLLLGKIQQGMERENILFENPNLFYPDGKHPNKEGHLILYDFLKLQQIW